MTPNSKTLLALSLCLCFLAAYGQSEPVYQITVAKNVMVPMRDGVKLATDIYFPAQGVVRVQGKFPVVLERTPYNKSAGAAAADHLVPHGYIVIFQDVRGRYKSEGRWRPIRDDPNDGFDTAQWIGSQPWRIARGRKSGGG